MKKTILIMLVMALSMGSQLQAAGNFSKMDNPKDFSRKISKFLKVHHLQLEEDILVDVHLKVNEYNELVVLRVNSKDKSVRDFICAALGNKEIGLQLDPSVKSYILPVRLKP